MNIFDGLEKIVEKDYPLSKKTWYRLGGNADYFITPNSVEQLEKIVQRCRENDIPMYVLGMGSNLLVPDEGIRAAVIQLRDGQFSKTEFDGDKITAWAGVEMSKLLTQC
ncbi:MAG: FAD-binding protein, partial [Planctomycetes bacterium]|nr:FAD-binding protein [Planctomycetota bacterium]